MGKLFKLLIVIRCKVLGKLDHMQCYRFFETIGQ